MSYLTLTMIVALLALAGGCEYSKPYVPPTPAEQVAEARREIDHERRLRQSIVLVVPKETAVLEALKADARVKSAHFASVNAWITASWIKSGEGSLGESYWFVLTFEAAKELTAEQAQSVLQSALAQAGLSLIQTKVPMVNDGQFWASEYPFEARLTPIAQPEPLTTASFEHLLQP